MIFLKGPSHSNSPQVSTPRQRWHMRVRPASPRRWGVGVREAEMTGTPRDHIGCRAVLIKRRSHKNQQESLLTCRSQGPAPLRGPHSVSSQVLSPSRCTLDRRGVIKPLVDEHHYRRSGPGRRGVHRQGGRNSVKGIPEAVCRGNRPLPA